MLHWLTKKRMIGGLVFGPPAWMPERIEDTFDAPAAVPAPTAATAPVPAPLADRASLLALLDRLGLGRTSQVIPGLVEQLRKADGPLKGLILNLLPTQPESALGGALSRLAIEDLAAGLFAIERAMAPGRTQIVLDRHDVRCWRRWRRAVRKWGAPAGGGRRPAIRLLLNRYPQADPTILIRILLGEKLPVEALPVTLGYLMVDSVTCWVLGRFLRTGQLFADRPVQLFVQENPAPRLVMGRIGEPLADFCRRHHVPGDLAAMQVIVNGVLTGRQVNIGGTRIEGLTESITLRLPAEIEAPTACLSCGWCVDVCPTGLTPVHLMQLAQRVPVRGAPRGVNNGVATTYGVVSAGNRALNSRAAREARHCLACGLCSYVCPTRLPLMEGTLKLRAGLGAAKMEVKNAS
jgi:electron transport complex protein RnfC